ncbi:transposase [Kineococcus sp. TBRC 1896]|uniref:Transposase n=1 Tax=Kineococcus mangrovi TaxID=1660183 RepID=A0ABV4IA61_9ACTN
MLPTEDLLVHTYVLIDDALITGAVHIPARPGPPPTCSDAEILTISVVRHLLHRRSEAAFRAELIHDHPGLFPHLPGQSQLNRRTRWLWGAFEQLRALLAATLPTDDAACHRDQVDTSALPVKHPSRVRGPDSWVGPAGLCARFGRDGAHGEWFYGFRLAVLTDLGSRLVRAWSIVPAAVNERQVALDLLADGPARRYLLCDKGFAGRAFAADLASVGTVVIVPPGKTARRSMPSGLLKVIAQWRNRVETTFGEITQVMDLARHGAHTFWGLLARTAATIAAHTLLRVQLTT